MKWITPLSCLLCISIPLSLLGCGVYTQEFYAERDYELGKTWEATVGSVMMAWETGTNYLQYGNVYRHKGLRRELSYSGITENVIHLSYREFSTGSTGDYARQAFAQELRYDLSSSKEITFREINIRLESADQAKIVYTVLKEPSEVIAVDENAKKK